MGPSGRFTHVMIYWTVWDRYMQVLYLGRRVVNGPPGFWASHVIRFCEARQ